MLLQGLKVVELASIIAGPSCAGILADWGASVVKVESPTGDRIRALYPDTRESPGNPVFTMENRGKRGVVLDTATGDGRSALIALLADADIFVTNVRPGALKRAGLDYETLKPQLPRLIYASITGAGLVGPEADLPAFDTTVFWAKSGLARTIIPPDQDPYVFRPGIGDHSTALATVAAILAAVHERHETGRGRLIECSLLRTAAFAIGMDLSAHLRFGQTPTNLVRDDRPVAMLDFFRTRDEGWICIQPLGPETFFAMVDLIGRPDLLVDPNFELPITDLVRVRELRGLIDAWFAGLTLEEAGAALTQADVA